MRPALDFVVGSLELAPAVALKHPLVAFRLFDFPTVVVEHPLKLQTGLLCTALAARARIHTNYFW